MNSLTTNNKRILLIHNSELADLPTWFITENTLSYSSTKTLFSGDAAGTSGNILFTESISETVLQDFLEQCDLWGNPIDLVIYHCNEYSKELESIVHNLQFTLPFLRWIFLTPKNFLLQENFPDTLSENTLFLPDEISIHSLYSPIQSSLQQSELTQKNMETQLKLHSNIEKLKGDLKLANLREEHILSHDYLTNLSNKQFFSKALEKYLLEKDDKLMALFFLDIDRFKAINISLGASVGDLLLSQFSHILQKWKKNLHPKTELGRISSDQFACIVPEFNNREEIQNTATELLQNLNESMILANNEIYINLNIGVAVCPQDGNTVHHLLRNAEEAANHAKQSGTNHIAFYKKEMNQNSRRSTSLEHRMRNAIANDEFVLFFQPQIDLKTDRFFGMESLIRWQHPELGFLSPGQFINIAEESGMIVPVGDWVMLQACKQVMAWLDAGLNPPPVAINVSGKQFKEPEFLEKVHTVLKKTKVPIEHIEFEITESALAGDPKEVQEKLEALHALDIRLAIDDFGTGYSSLSYLQQFPIDVLKIDQSFVREILKNTGSRDIVKTIIDLGCHLNLTVLAEGIETPKERNLLLELGCHIGQGYWYDKPLDHQTIENILKNSDGFFPKERMKIKD